MQADTAAEQPADTLAEVIVTATKRETNVQDTPVADTVFSQSALDENHVSDITDLAKFVPGVAYAQQGDQGATQITLRGIGNDSAFTELDSPEVATYVNGIYAPRAQGTSSLMYDVDRVEVLRGPQGTLFGHNSTVGVVDIFTARPKLEAIAGNVEAYFGNYNATGVRGMFNLPVTDTLGFRFAYVTQRHDGYAAFQSIPPGLASNPVFSQNGSAGLNTSVFVTGGTHYYGETASPIASAACGRRSTRSPWNVSFENYKDTGGPVVPLMQNRGPASRSGPFSRSSSPTTIAPRTTSVATWSGGSTVISISPTSTAIPGSAATSGRKTMAASSSPLHRRRRGTAPSKSRTRSIRSSTPTATRCSSSPRETTRSTGSSACTSSASANRIRFDINQYNGYAGGQFNWAGAFIQPDRSQEDKSAFGQAVWHVTDGLRLTAGVRNSFDDERDIGGRNVTFNGCANCGPYTYGLSLQQLVAPVMRQAPMTLHVISQDDVPWTGGFRSRGRTCSDISASAPVITRAASRMAEHTTTPRP